MQNKDNIGMYDEQTKQSVNFAPRYINNEQWVEANESSTDEQQPCSPSKIFQRHGSLAELSTIAVTEKEALDRQENSQCSDSSECCSTIDIENENQGQEYGCLNQNVGAQLEVHSTPTKIPPIESTPCNDPLTPTANLKMLMSVVSPAIRDRDEKKRDLFVGNADNVLGDIIIEKPNAYSRKDKSLGLLCQRFLAMFPEDPGGISIEISLDEISKDLKVERRRVYDIVNVLESVEVLSRLAKNRYLWHGKSRIIQTLEKLKALSRNSIYQACKKHERKENLPNTPSSGKQKMKRHFSCGDLPKPNRQLKERNLTKEEERLMMKAAIDSTDNCRKDKSLGVLSQKFLIMFLLSKGGVVTLEDAATVLLEEHDERNVKYKTKVRRLYDIANILSSLKLIEKVHIRGAAGKKPGFKWIGVDIESLPENAMPSGSVVTFKTKHSLLPDPTIYPTVNHQPTHIRQPHILPSPSLAHSSTVNPNKRWTKSASCSASFVRRSSSKDEGGIKRERSNSSTADRQDGFLVHEFASSPVNVFGRDMSLYSPTEVTFREEIQKLREKFPDRMSQLLAVLPPYLPSSCPGSVNKTSRRNLFTKNKLNSGSAESNAKRVRTNSEGDFHTVQADSNNCTDTDTQKDVASKDENQDPNKAEIESKFMHSTNSPFKTMSSCAYKQSEYKTQNPVPANMNIMLSGRGRPVLGERLQQGMFMKEPHQRSSCQWQHMAGRFTPRDGRTSPMVQLVDQAVSPIPPSKLAPRSSIAIQASLIKDISPLKPLVFLHHRIPSPWKPPAVSPSNIPPAPPPTPELPNKASMGPFQSQGNQMFIRSVSPYPSSQSCGSSPVGPFTGAKLFFPPLPNAPGTNGMILPHVNLLYGVNQVAPPTMTPPLSSHQSNSCPPSVNPSPTPLDSGLTHTPGLVVPHSQIPSPFMNVPAGVPTQTPQHFTMPANLTPVTEAFPFTPCHLQQPGKQPCMLMNARGLGETPSSCMDTVANENVSRKLCLANGNV